MLKRLAVALTILIMTGACALHTRPIGTKDPAVEIAKENGTTIRALAEAMKAQAEAMSRLAIASLALPTPTPTPEDIR